jgi:hypothetical protein
MHSGSGGNQALGAGGAGGVAPDSDAAGAGIGAGGAPTVSDAADGGADGTSCDGSAMAGTWYRASDGLVMILAARGCNISGTSDNPYYRHTIAGIYDEVARTMVGTIHRTTVSNACVTVMQTTWVLTDSRHFTMAIVGTDGLCNLAATYNEVSTLVRQSLPPG